MKITRDQNLEKNVKYRFEHYDFLSLQQCFTDFYVTEQGFLYYDLGCRIEDVSTNKWLNSPFRAYNDLSLTSFSKMQRICRLVGF